jgi:hypothetical protein
VGEGLKHQTKTLSVSKPRRDGTYMAAVFEISRWGKKFGKK